MTLQRAVVTVTTTGSSGSATGNATSDVFLPGKIVSVYADFTGAPGTTTFTIHAVNGGGSGVNILLYTSAAGNTDRHFVPAINADKTSDGSASGQYLPVYIGGHALKFTVANSDNAATVKFTVLVEGV